MSAVPPCLEKTHLKRTIRGATPCGPGVVGSSPCMEPLQPGEAPLYDAVGGEGRPVHSAILFKYHYSIGPGVVNEKNAKAKSDKKIKKASLSKNL